MFTGQEIRVKPCRVIDARDRFNERRRTNKKARLYALRTIASFASTKLKQTESGGEFLAFFGCRLKIEPNNHKIQYYTFVPVPSDPAQIEQLVSLMRDKGWFSKVFRNQDKNEPMRVRYTADPAESLQKILDLLPEKNRAMLQAPDTEFVFLDLGE